MDIETFSVLDFSGTDQISHLYEYKVSLISSNANISAADVLNKPATLFMFRDGEYYPYSGIVSQGFVLYLMISRALFYKANYLLI
jgi:type VI secretion system secreted protein VgrG